MQGLSTCQHTKILFNCKKIYRPIINNNNNSNNNYKNNNNNKKDILFFFCLFLDF